MVDIVKNINKFIEPNFRDPGRNPENRYAIVIIISKLLENLELSEK